VVELVRHQHLVHQRAEVALRHLLQHAELCAAARRAQQPHLHHRVLALARGDGLAHDFVVARQLAVDEEVAVDELSQRRGA
jgi:hypothetical protein